jgi:outer membrane protein assembly factor BamB
MVRRSVVAVLVPFFLLCLSSPAALNSFIKMKDGYFADSVTGKPWVPHGIAYQTWNRPLGVWQTHEQIDYDLDEMVKMGANSIRVDFVWQHIEEDGDNQWKWENYDYLVQAAEKRGLRIFALIGYQWPPNWFPDAWYTMHPPATDSEGIYHPTRWQSDIINYEHPQARAQYAEWFSNVCSRYKDSKAIVAWIIGNESGYLGLWSGLLDGYDPESEQAFRAFLQAKFGTVPNVNARWGTSYTSFDEIKFVEEFREYGQEGAQWADMVQWREDSIATFTAIGAAAAKAADTNHLISYSTVGMQWGEEDWRYHAEDRGKITAACLETNAPIDFFSVNNYPWSVLGHESQNGQWGVSYTKKVAGVPVLYSETGFTSSETMWPGMNEMRQGPLIRNALWESLQAGAIGTHIFAWHDRPYITDREKGFGILYENRGIKPAFWTSRDTFNLMEQVQIHELLAGSQDPKPDIAFLWTAANDSQYNRYECEMQQMAGALERAGFEPNFINLNDLASGAYTNFKVVVLPRNMRVDSEVPGTGKGVMKFLREDVIGRGISILASADLPGMQDENGRPRADFTTELAALFGIDGSDASGFEIPPRTGTYIGPNMEPITVVFSNAWGELAGGYTCTPRVWKYSDEIKVTDGSVWATMDVRRNKGFEDSDSSVAAWYTWGGMQVNHNWGWQYEGNNMLQMWGDAGIWQNFQVAPGGTYAFTAFLRSNSDDPLRNGKEAFLVIEWYDKNDNKLGQAESAHLTGATPNNSWVPYRVEGSAPNNAVTGRRVIRIGGSGDGSLFVDGNSRSPAVVVKDHGTARAAIFLFSAGDISPDGDLDGQMDVLPWKWRYDYFGAMVREYFGVQPAIRILGDDDYLCMAEYRTCTNGATLWQIKNYMYDRFAANGVGGPSKTFTIQSSLLKGKTVKAFEQGRVLESPCDGKIELTLPPDGQEILYVYDHDTAVVSSNLLMRYTGAIDWNDWLLVEDHVVNSEDNSVCIDVNPSTLISGPLSPHIYDGFAPGDTVTYTLWIKQDNDPVECEGRTVCLRMEFCRTNGFIGQVCGELIDAQSPSNEWIPVSITASVPPETAIISVGLQCRRPMDSDPTPFAYCIKDPCVYNVTAAPSSYADGSSDGRMWQGSSAHSGDYADGPESLVSVHPQDSYTWIGRGPVVEGNYLYTVIDSTIRCTDILTHSTVWTYNGSENFNERGLAVVDGVVYASTKVYGGYYGHVYAVAAPGVVLWQHTGASYSCTPPLVKDGIAYFGGKNDTVHAVDAATGAVIWESTNVVSSSDFGDITMGDGKLFIYGNGWFQALDAQNGALLWTKGTGRSGWSESSPVYSDGRVYLANDDSNNGGRWIKGYSSADGTHLWTLTVSNSLMQDVSPAVVNGRLYIGDRLGYAHCFNAISGAHLWTVELPEEDIGAYRAVAAPLVSNGKVYFTRYRIHALDAETGAIAWTSSENTYGLSTFYGMESFVKNEWLFVPTHWNVDVYHNGVAWPGAPVEPEPQGGQVVMVKDAPGVIHPADRCCLVKIAYDTRGRTDLVLKSAFVEVGDNGDGTANEQYVVVTNAAEGADIAELYFYIPDPNQSDADYISTPDGGQYQFTAWLEDAEGQVVASALPFATRLEWALRPVTTIPTNMVQGVATDIDVEWEELYEQYSWQNTPLARNDSFPSRIAVLRSSKTEAQYPGHFNRANTVADWLESMGYQGGNPLDISFDNLTAGTPRGEGELDAVIDAETATTKSTGVEKPKGWVIWNNGFIENAHDFGEGGLFHFRVRMYGSPAAGVWPGMELWIDRQAVTAITVTATSYTNYDMVLNVPAGVHNVAVAFTNDYYVEPEDRNLYVDKIIINKGTQPKVVVYDAEDMPLKTTGGSYPQGWIIWSGGSLQLTNYYLSQGSYRITMRAYGTPAVGVWPWMPLRINGQKVKEFYVDSGDYRNYSAIVDFAAGNYNIAFAFTNDYCVPPEDRNIYADTIWIEKVEPAQTMLADSFNAGMPANWTREAGCANWTVDNGTLRASRIGNSDNILMSDEIVTNATISADIRYNTQDKYFNDAEVYFRYQDRDNFYKVGIRNFYGFWRLKYTVRQGASIAQQGWICDFPKTNRPVEDTWYNLKIESYGITNKVYFDNKYVGEFTATQFASGRVGVGSMATQLGIWEPQKGYYFIDDDEYSFWAPEGQAQVTGRPLNLDYGYLMNFYRTLILPSVYVMNDTEVSNILTWANGCMSSVISMDGGAAMKNETGAYDLGRLEGLFGVQPAVTEVSGLSQFVVGDKDHYVTLDYTSGASIPATGNAKAWNALASGEAMGTVQGTEGTVPAGICNTLRPETEAPTKAFCFNMGADTYNQILEGGSLRTLAQRAFEWSRGQAYKIQMELKYPMNPDVPDYDLTLYSTSCWVLVGSGTNTFHVSLPTQGMMTGENLYWVMWMHPWASTQTWVSQAGYYTSGNDGPRISVDGLGLQLIGASDKVYAGRLWDMLVAYNCRTQNVTLTFGLKEKGDLLYEDHFKDGNYNGWTPAADNRVAWNANAGWLESKVVNGTTGGYANIVWDGVSVSGRNITVEFDVMFSNAAYAGFLYRGTRLEFGPGGVNGEAGWRDDAVQWHAPGNAIAPQQWHHVAIHIRDGEPYLKSDLLVDSKALFLNEPIEVSDWTSEAVGLVSPMAHSNQNGQCVLFDNVRIVDEEYGIAYVQASGISVPTDGAPTFFSFVPDYDPEMWEYEGATMGARNEWYVYMRGEDQHTYAKGDVYFVPRLCTEDADFPTNLVAGESVEVPVEWENLPAVPAGIQVKLTDAYTGQSFGWTTGLLTQASGSSAITVTVAENIPAGSNYVWTAYTYPTNEIDPWGGRYGCDDTFRFDPATGVARQPEVEVSVKTSGLPGGDLVVYSDAGFMPAGMVVNTWAAYYTTFDALSTGVTPPEGSKSFLMSSPDWAGWGVFVPNTYDLSAFTNGYLSFYFRNETDQQVFKVEMEGPVGNKVTKTFGHVLGQYPSGQWHKVTFPASDFAGIDFSQVYGVFMFSSFADTQVYVDDVRWSLTP